MTHLTRDQFNALLESDLDAPSRMHAAEHLFTCSTCQTRFQALHALHRQLAPRRLNKLNMGQLIPAVAAAAILAVALFVLARQPLNQPQSTPPVTQSTTTDLPADASGLLTAVQEVNRKEMLRQWGQETTIVEVLKSQRQL